MNLPRLLAYLIHGTREKNPRRKSARRGRPRDWRYRAWIRSLPSVVSGRMGCEAAHTGSDGGMSMKATDYSCVPLTLEEHLEYHRLGRDGFERLSGICFSAEVENLNAIWRAKTSQRRGTFHAK